MLKSVESYSLNLGFNTVSLPMAANVVGCSIGSEEVWLYAEGWQDSDLEERKFCVVATGESVPASARYVGRCGQGGKCLHVFELTSVLKSEAYV